MRTLTELKQKALYEMSEKDIELNIKITLKLAKFSKTANQFEKYQENYNIYASELSRRYYLTNKI